MIVEDSKTGLSFCFQNNKEKEHFFELWDKYEIQEVKQ